MSAYFTTSNSNFIVSDVNKEKAIESAKRIRFLESTPKFREVEIGDGRCILDFDEPLFDGDWCSSGPDAEAVEFLGFCEDGSYLSMYCDDYREFSFYWKEDGVVSEDWKCVEDPFMPVINRLDDKALGIFKR